MGIYKIFGFNVGFGKKEYGIGLFQKPAPYGDDFTELIWSTGYYKTRKGAEKKLSQILEKNKRYARRE